ncbi:MAG: hypothetical protein IK020_10940 [Clostridiales bacterium]|nr:hypothetical protein [Clostridiales bacterium]
MKALTKLFSLIMMISVLVCVSLPANALTSTLNVSAGSTVYTNIASVTTANRSSCHIALDYVKFNSYPANVIPSSYFVYAALCTPSNHLVVTNEAGFSAVNSSGYYYGYLSGYGGEGQPYVLKTHSNLNMYYSARFIWTSDGQAAS